MAGCFAHCLLRCCTYSLTPLSCSRAESPSISLAPEAASAPAASPTALAAAYGGEELISRSLEDMLDGLELGSAGISRVSSGFAVGVEIILAMVTAAWNSSPKLKCTYGHPSSCCGPE